MGEFSLQEHFDTNLAAVCLNSVMILTKVKNLILRACGYIKSPFNPLRMNGSLFASES